MRAGGDVVGGRGVFRRSPEVSDAIWIGDALVVLSGTRLSHVDGLGAVVWDALGAPLSYESLRHVVLERMPAPPPGIDADAAFDAAIEALRRRGVVQGVDPVGSAGQPSGHNEN